MNYKILMAILITVGLILGGWYTLNKNKNSSETSLYSDKDFLIVIK